jgi:hypothetical protein
MFGALSNAPLGIAQGLAGRAFESDWKSGFACGRFGGFRGGSEGNKIAFRTEQL